jgi:uncharacterized cupin superfamily protein
MKIANLHESPSREFAIGHIKGVWRDLGREVGTRKVGLRRIEIAEGHFSTPAHDHGADEEIFFVLGGEGLLWQDGKTHEVGPGDCIVHRPKRGPHTLRGAAGGLDVLVFGQRLDAALTALPRAGVAWSFPRWVELGDGDPPFAREAAAGAPECAPPEAQRPRNVVALADVPAVFDGRARRCGQAAGAVATGLNHVVLPSGGKGAQAHCHSAEEELFVVLDGSGVLELWGGGAERPEEHRCAPATPSRASPGAASHTRSVPASRDSHTSPTAPASQATCASTPSPGASRCAASASPCAPPRSITCPTSEL